MAGRLRGAEALPEEWYGCLMFTPLYTRPVVLEMMREWFGHLLVRQHVRREDFFGHFDRILWHQIRRILLQNELPDIMAKSERTPFGSMPLLGHMAIYSLNLLLLRTVLHPEGYEFREREIESREEGPRPWDRLSSLWRSWFSMDSLRGLAAIWTAVRSGDRVVLKARPRFGGSSSSNGLRSLRDVGSALADGVTAGLAGLMERGREYATFGLMEDVREELLDAGIDIHVDLLMRRLRACSLGYGGGYGERIEDA